MMLQEILIFKSKICLSFKPYQQKYNKIVKINFEVFYIMYLDHLSILTQMLTLSVSCLKQVSVVIHSLLGVLPVSARSSPLLVSAAGQPFVKYPQLT